MDTIEALEEQERIATKAWAHTRAEVLRDTIKVIKGMDNRIFQLMTTQTMLINDLKGCELELKYADRRIKDMQKGRFKGVEGK